MHPGESASGEALHPEGGLHPGVGQTLLRALQDTVNKRAVRILLECILVYFNIEVCNKIDFVNP